MDFINDPRLALEAFSRDPCDLVVADMKMPGMDGADLLTEIKRRHPESIRIILSGHSDPEGSPHLLPREATTGVHLN
jgi:YesN/AraC family two-component response regulator